MRIGRIVWTNAKQRGLRIARMAAVLGAVASLYGCPDGFQKPCCCLPGLYHPLIDPENFVAGVDNPFFPLVPGTTFRYVTETDEGTEETEVYVTHETKEVLGVTCIVVRDTVTLDGDVIELTYDWYAQDADGNVWYMGEASMEYEGDMVVSTFGSWEGGVNCAQPGIIMEAHPRVGDTYRQEYYRCVAEDMATVVSLDEAVTVPHGSFNACLETEDFTRLDPDVLEQKFYAAGVGQVLTIEDDVREELVSVTTE